MSNQGVDPLILNAWLSARSIVRGLPSPVPEYGGFRVDTKSDAEVARWVFPRIGSGLEQLARSISEPRFLLKLCGAADELRAVLPMGWELHTPSYFMQATGKPPARRLADGYRIEAKRVGMVFEARIFSEIGALAASGYAAETRGVVIYDRIVTEPEHRRKGLGHALMLTLHDARQHPSSPELLVATEDGRALYSALGWETISPYSTASIVTP
ncbi:GNAT family N-acetyltransferase [Novosphingobium sp. FGD1]|uniref:GNAT family N-acetyltransferase n=2 Tax=Sphingomonadaceae TaxID=41297 RepID=A0A7X4K652_9SPHN|nr:MULTISPECIES: GNAT family N-acetyltransferase [Sphingomonadaceae]MDR6787344.1 GNAT superfamily N-acetyltransferase [Sphingomonas sp. BE138]MYL96789.1 GNAT family N-acetyltransferase [Novosphingobium silvae]